MEITVSPESVSVESNTVVLVDQTLDAEVVYSEPLIQVHSGNNFVLSSEGQYSSNGLVGQIPKWILDAIEQKLSTGDGNIMSVVNDMKMLLDSLSIGVDHVVSELNTLSLSQNSLVTSVSSQLQEDKAQIMNLLASKVDSDSATAIAAQAIDSKFGGDVDAYIGSIASTYVDENSAIAQNLEVLRSTLGDVSASVTDISSATVENVLNPLWIDDGNGTDPDINGNSKWILQAKAKKQLQVDANGVISGIILESGETSSVTILGDEFKLVATGQAVASRNPFTVNATTGEIAFNGKVSFSSVTDVPQLGSTPQEVVDAVNAGSTTTIDGGKITTGTLQANTLKAGVNDQTVWTGGGLISSNFNGYSYGNIGSPTSGFRLSSNAAGTASDPNIYGAYIKGGTVEGATISGSNINVGTLKVFSAIYPNNFGNLFYFNFKYNPTSSSNVSIISGTMVGEGYGTGFLSNRICSSSSIIEIDTGGGATDSGTIILQVSINGGAYTTFFTGESLSFYRNFAVTYSPPTSYSTITFKAVPSTSNVYIRHLKISVYNI